MTKGYLQVILFYSGIVVTKMFFITVYLSSVYLVVYDII